MRTVPAVIGVAVALAVAAGAVALAVASTAGGGAGGSAADASPSATASARVSATDFCYVESEIYYGVEEVELAETLLGAEGVSEQARAFAEDVRETRSAEIEKLRAWYLEWIDAKPVEPAADGPCAGHGDHAQMPGMPSWTQLSAFAAAEGEQAEQLYVELMTRQLEGEAAVAAEFLAAQPHPRVGAAAERRIAVIEDTLGALAADLAQSAYPGR